MIITNHSQPKVSVDLIDFLQQKVGLSQKALDLGIRQAELEQAPLPVVLWSFGLLSLEQYIQVIDWQEENMKG